ncbi:Gp138 family membrane-puncturing spike protein [Pantoea sp.]|uniref:Gp138 family membrane-puncturing spike protein n=1 Tax=Pantoea sp. TaxID=69393 RepID=UPI00290991A3|nr:Gp138 family membrane-puncturing spike protein [Pantoea sp.]MDU5475922.1 Gp138 family membrane-puncturing spike protein [Pantoea sp.]
MPVSLNSQVGSSEQMSEQLYNSIFSMLRVSMPGIIQSFDPHTLTCTVQPALTGQVADTLGNFESAPLPLLVDVPVVFPRGGGCTLTFPIQEGDECLVVFSDRCIDFWWQNGGVQEPVDPRQHDLSDAFALVGPMSQAQKISAVNMNAVELRSDEGDTKISLNPTAGTIEGTAPGGFNLNGLRILGDGRLQLVDGSIVDKHTHGGVEKGGSSTNPLGA